MVTRTTTFEYTIWIGFQQGYDGHIHTFEEVVNICRWYCDKVGLGLTVTPTTFVYTGGQEDGARIGLINYPRFPKHGIEIENQALELADILMNDLGQIRCSIVGPQETIMLGPSDD